MIKSTQTFSANRFLKGYVFAAMITLLLSGTLNPVAADCVQFMCNDAFCYTPGQPFPVGFHKSILNEGVWIDNSTGYDNHVFYFSACPSGMAVNWAFGMCTNCDPDICDEQARQAAYAKCGGEANTLWDDETCTGTCKRENLGPPCTGANRCCY